MKTNNTITIFGEVLFDQFPDGVSVLGGAPFNVAWHLQAFRQNLQFISRVGSDLLGSKIRQAMLSWGMDVSLLQVDSFLPTGQVQIAIHAGEPSYSILPNRAYDYIEALGENQISRTGILYHGTLAARSEKSRNTLDLLKKQHEGTVFVDVNLRQPWWDKTDVLQLLDDADWVKLNKDELTVLQTGSADLKASMAKLLSKHSLKGVILTCGEKGALAMNNKGEFFSVAPNTSAQVVDTVGAGDAFSTIILLGINLGWPLETCMERAQLFASAITKQQGATVNDLKFYLPFIEPWHL